MRDGHLLDDDGLTTVGLLFEVASGTAALLAPQIAEAGLSESEFEVLLRLSRSPEGQLRMSDLADQVALSSSGLTRLVDRLEARGLVTRQACPADRRGLFAVVTDAGRARVVQTLPGHLALIEEWVTGVLTATQRHQLVDALRAVRASVRPAATAGADGPDAALTSASGS